MLKVLVELGPWITNPKASTLLTQWHIEGRQLRASDVEACLTPEAEHSGSRTPCTPYTPKLTPENIYSNPCTPKTLNSAKPAGELLDCLFSRFRLVSERSFVCATTACAAGLAGFGLGGQTGL